MGKRIIRPLLLLLAGFLLAGLFGLMAPASASAAAPSDGGTAWRQHTATIPAPANLAAKPDGNGNIQLSWDPVTGAASYNVYRSTASQAESLYFKGDVAPTFLNTSKILKGTTYYYQVTAVDANGGESALSNEAASTTDAIVAIPTPTPVVVPVTPKQTNSAVTGFAVLGLIVALGAAIGALFVWRRMQPHEALPATPLPSESPVSAPLPPSGWTVPPGVTLPPQGGVASWGDDAAASTIVPPSALPSLPQPPQAASSYSTRDWEALTPAERSGVSMFAADEPIGGLMQTYPPPPPSPQPLWPTPGASRQNRGASPITIGLIVGGVLVVLAVIVFIILLIVLQNPMNGSTVAPIPTNTSAAATQIPTITPLPTNSPAPTQSATAVTPTTLAINSGGDVAGNFVADTDVNGGATDATQATIDTGNVQNPAPQAVYQSERYGEFTYMIGSLTAGMNYQVRLHFAEIYFTKKNQRVFNVAINGTSVLQNFDIVAKAGAPKRAIVEAFSVKADTNGQIAIKFTNGPQNTPQLSGLELIPQN